MHTLGFIGAGNMAGAIIQGLIESGFATDRLLICDRNEDKRARFAEQGCHVTAQAADVMEQADAVVLAVKPQVLREVISPLAEMAQQRQPLILSVVAAIDSAAMESWLGGALPLIRTMPNTPSMVGEGATGLFANASATADHKAFAEQVFSSIGTVTWVEDEALLHAVTAAAGSAPAYFFRFAEAMAKTALEQGLTEAQARELIGQTMLGAAKMILQSEQSLSDMRKAVCSPNGTTERAIFSFQDDNIDAVVERAMRACYHRSEELSEALTAE